MKKSYFIGEPMGIGKTTVSERLNQLLEHSVILDGDWCWNMNPFIVNEENKRMVIGTMNDGIRDEEVIVRSIARLVKYEQVHSEKINTTNLSIEGTAQEIMRAIHH